MPSSPSQSSRPQIRILSDRVANQIAAGEVIERPVAVVKELVENSLDSGASRIEVEFKNGGKSYIRVEDNGCGMSPDSAMLALERHATSKIREAADLLQVGTFGFRGEALPSIASVSKFTLRTRSDDLEHGIELRLSGGRLLDRRECGMPVGTCIEVAHLFNSVPARRKFLKTEQTEAAHITYLTRLCAVAHPEVGFRVLDNGRELFKSPACKDLRERVGEIWGFSLANDLIEVDHTDPSTGLQLKGLIARPGIGRATRRDMVTMVNHRPVESRTLGYGILDAYHGYLTKGRYPPTFLFLEMPTDAVDVNVHPAKREVRFRDEGMVRRFLIEALTQTLEKFQSSRRVPESSVKTSSTLPHGKAEVARPAVSPRPQLHVPSHSPGATQPAEDSGKPGAVQLPRPASKSEASPSRAEPPAGPETPPTPVAASADGVSTVDWRLIGRWGRRYALFESPRGLFVLHLRHAHERVRYEAMLSAEEDGEVVTQRLLVPIPIEFEPVTDSLFKENRKIVQRGGFAVEPFGRHFYRIEAIPGWLEPGAAEQLLRDFVDQLRDRAGSGAKGADASFQRFAQLAASHAVRRDDRLTDEAVRRLLADLWRCQNPHTNPLGKATFEEITESALAKRFQGG